MKVSIVTPIYNMDNALEFLKQNLDSVLMQIFKDYEIVITDDSTDDMLMIWLRQHYPMIKYFKNPNTPGLFSNTNCAIDNATGELIKILYQDDCFADENSLQRIVDNFDKDTKWLFTGCSDNPHPHFDWLVNKLGNPSGMTLRGGEVERFNPKLHWISDLLFYRKLYEKYGVPKILDEIGVIIGKGPHQLTNKLSDEAKKREENLL